MSAKLYPFIDIAVHERVREHFARGDAAVLFSADMLQVLWSNGEGASLFGLPSIYDFIDSGANTGDVSFRQMEATGRQLARVGDSRSFLMRIGSGFRRMPVHALVEMISVHPGETAILFTAPGNVRARTPADIARAMISGFDDPDTHMAVLDGDGGIVASSPGFESLAMTPQTCRTLVTAVARDADWLVKRPIPTGKGHLPAAIGKLSDTPALHLLFAVETILGNLDPGTDFDEETVAEDATPSDIPETPTIVSDLEALSDVTGTPETPAGIEDAAIFNQEDQSDLASIEPDASTHDQPDNPVAQDEESENASTAGSEDMSADAEQEAFVETDSTLSSDGRSEDDAGDIADTDADAEPEGTGLNIEAANEAFEEADRTETAEIASASVSDIEAEAGNASDDLDPEATIAEVAETVVADNDVVADTAAANSSNDAETTNPDETANADIAAAHVGTEIPNEQIVDDSARDLASSSEPETSDTDSEAGHSGFVFNPNSRAVRFVWKIDSEGRFREISDEFAMAVGPASADISGVTFSDIAERYNLDVDGKIGELLKRRDTWSGKTILWPVEGTSLHVPVDLAALPTYSRNREFDGFRGFGIVRVADAIEDQHATGLTLGLPLAEPVGQSEDFGSDGPSLPFVESENAALADAGAPVEETPSAEAYVGEAQPADLPDLEDTVFAGEETSQEADEAGHGTEGPSTGLDDDAPSTADGEQTSEDIFEDPFRGERPALQIADNPGRRTSDKVVRLDNHRPQGIETLTRGEQAAFREIARQLGETFGKRQDAATLEETDEQSETYASAQPEAVTDDMEDAAVVSTTEIPVEQETENEAVGEEPGVAASETIEAEDRPEAVAEIVDALPTRSSIHAGSLNQDLLDSLPVALLVHAGDELFHANPEFLELTGFSSLDELREEGGIDALFVAEDDGLFDMPDGTMMLIRNDGRLVPVNARLQSIRWEEKSALVMALSAATQDAKPVETADTDAEPTPAPATADQIAIDSLRMEAEELRSILETATDGVAIIDAGGEIRSLNRSANALFNYDDGEIRGKPFAMLFAHESQKAVLDYLAGLSGHGVASVLNDGREVIGREASGGFIPLFMTMGRLASSNGYCAVIRDITQWKRTEEELRNAKRAAETANAHKTDFLARVSHEIRTPLNAIIGFSDMMASEHFGPIGNPRYVEYAGDIGRSGRHVLDIVNDLLDISKIEAGEMDLEFTAVEINDAVSEAVSLVQPQANSQRVIIRTSLSGSVPNIVADSRSIKQIALNILSNAIRFTPSGGQIVVSTAYETNGSVILRIRDTGIGMTRTELEQAMKPFRQVTTGARKRGDGTGLGLPLTKAMAEANRAQFSINSAPNEGTLVEISFPSQRVLAD